MIIENLKYLKGGNRKKIIIIIAVTLAILVGIVGCIFYNPLKEPIRTFARFFPFPVALVDGKIISTKEIIEDALAVEKFYRSQDFSTAGMRVDFSTPDGKTRLKIKEKDVLDKKIENLIIMKLANGRGIEIGKSEAQKILQEQVNEAGNEQAFEQNLKKIYGWDTDDFRDKVVIPQLYMRKLADYYYEKEAKNDKSYQVIEKAKEELKQDGSNFGEVAKKYSQGKSADNEGELGWFRQDQLVPEVAREIFTLKENEVSGVIISSLGYHIIQVQQFREVEKKENENGLDDSDAGASKEMEVKIRQIYIAGGGFIDWLFEQKKGANVRVLAKQYKWDVEKVRVVFSDERMNKQEDELKIKSQGDPSMN